MSKKYSQLTNNERYHIGTLLQDIFFNRKDISKSINHPLCTIPMGINRNSVNCKYETESAIKFKKKIHYLENFSD